jgi:uncharacterized protein YecE (DUF72 family)
VLAFRLGRGAPALEAVVFRTEYDCKKTAASYGGATVAAWPAPCFSRYEREPRGPHSDRKSCYRVDGVSRASRPQPRVGCSGWNYKAWRNEFYPNRLPAARWLEYYASTFDTVELNNTFYRLPERSMFAAWRAQVPRDFVFAVKANGFLTHMKRLRDPEEPIARLFARATALGLRLGPVLYQLPGNFTIDLHRLERFLCVLPRTSGRRRIRHVMEFRHPSWYVSDTFHLLDEQGIALCLHDKHGSSIAEPVVGPFVYVRFHGTSGMYHGGYSGRQLSTWAHRLAERASDGLPVYAYFNNDPGAVAVENALTVRSILRKLVR